MTPVSIRKSPRLNSVPPNSAAMLQLTIGDTSLSPVEVLTLGMKLAAPVIDLETTQCMTVETIGWLN